MTQFIKDHIQEKNPSTDLQCNKHHFIRTKNSYTGGASETHNHRWVTHLVVPSIDSPNVLVVQNKTTSNTRVSNLLVQYVIKEQRLENMSLQASKNIFKV